MVQKHLLCFTPGTDAPALQWPGGSGARLGPAWDAGRVNREDLVRLRRTRDRMDRDFAEPLDVPALAREALMSPGHFSRSFRTAFGETP